MTDLRVVEQWFTRTRVDHEITLLVEPHVHPLLRCNIWHVRGRDGDMLVLVAAMVPAPGETPAEWWENTGHGEAVAEQSELDGGLTGNDDPYIAYYHDVPRVLAEVAMSKERDESDTAYNSPWPLDAWPAVPTKFILCSDDRLFPSRFMRRVVAERLGIVADEIVGGHYVALSRSRELAGLLAGYVDPPVGGTGC